MTTKNVVLLVVLALIGGAIWYLEAGVVHPNYPVVANNGEIPVDIAIENAAQATDSSTTSTASETPEAQTTTSAPAKPATVPDRIRAKASKYGRVKEIVDPSGFINASDTFKLANIVGKKVILLDFWTYSCINCQRTTPYLEAWYDKYKDEGLEIVGVHTPEFDFEKVYANVLAAVNREGIKYPVVMDNNYGTWTAYGNRFWPRKYLIDIDGFIVYDRIGEGAYDETEQKIQQALAERAQVLSTHQAISSGLVHPDLGMDASSGGFGSPETYFGAARNDPLANGVKGTVGDQTLSAPSSPALNGLYLDGAWHFEPEYAENTSAEAKIVYRYAAQNVYFVASSASGVKLRILRDGQPLTQDLAGEDVTVQNGEATMDVKENRLYKLIHEPSFGTHTLEIDIESPGLDAYTFTFG